MIGSREVPQKSKQTMYKTYYPPVFTYAAQTQVIKKNYKSRIQTCEIKLLLIKVGVTKRNKEETKQSENNWKNKPFTRE